MIDHCTQLLKLSEFQRTFIEQHIEHKSFNHKKDKNEAVNDFIKKFARHMRESYCGSVCAERFKCEIAQEYLPKAS